MSTRIFNIRLLWLLGLLWLLLTSCKTQYVEVEKPVIVEHTTTTHHTDIVRDTLMMRDSVYHLIKGDTVIIEKWHHVNSVHNVLVADTVHDSIPIIQEVKVPVEVEKQLTKWEKTKMDMGGMAIGALVLIIVALIVYAIVKLRKMTKIGL